MSRISDAASRRAADRAGSLPEVHHGHDRPAIGLQHLAPPAKEVPSDQAAGGDERYASEQEVSSSPRHSKAGPRVAKIRTQRWREGLLRVSVSGARPAGRLQNIHDAAQSWSRFERIIARVEAGLEGTDTRFIVTSLEGGRTKYLYQRLYCPRGQAENHIKAWKTHLAADRTSCHPAEANQFRLFLHAGAYWLLWSMGRVMPKRSIWQIMQFDTLRLRLIKLAPRRRTENPNQDPPAIQRPRSGDLRHAARPPAASRHLRAGA